jgi:hypothetical protein
MKPAFLAALALPVLLTGCGTYVGYDGYGPGYYDPGYYDGVYGDVAVYGYDRGGYQPHYHHYDGSYHNSGVASRSFSHASHVASAGRVGGGHVGGGGGAAHASASAGHR